MLNKQQQYAIDARNCNLLVSASAGSGKTKVLITRIAKMIANKETSVSKLLVVTFTKASAVEMKERLIAELSEIRQNSTEENFKSYILSQIEEIPLCDISTIHSFCAKVVRKYFYELNLDPAFKLVEDSLTELKLDAVNSVISTYINANDSEFKNLFFIFNEKRNNLNLIQTIFSVSDIMHKTNNNSKQKTELSFNKNLELNSAMQYINNFINRTVSGLQLKIKDYVSNCIILDDKFTEHLSFCLNFLKSVQNAHAITEKIKLITEVIFPNLTLKQNKLKENKEDYVYIRNIIKTQLINKIVNIFGKLVCEKSIIESIESSSWLTKKLIEVTEKYNEVFYQLKYKNAILDLADVEELMIKLLENNNVVNDLKQTYDYIFIDEYQDTNEIQEHILTKIAKIDNMFMVGDAKQSIYGFRLCDPTIFTNKYNNFKDFGFNQKVDLNKNYRSNKHILNFTNQVCSKCITENIGNINYLKDAMLETEIEIKKVNGSPSVQIYAIPKKEKEEKQTILIGEEIYSVKEAQLSQEKDNETAIEEAKLIALKIATFVGQEYEVTVNNQTQKREIKYSDICILSRKKKGYLQKLASVLSEYDIPVKCSYTDNIYEHFEVKILIDALKTINNYFDDVSIISTMHNLYNFSFNELVSIREKYAYEKYFYQALTEYKEKENNDLSKKINEFFIEMENFKVKSGYYSLFELVNEIAEKTNYINLITCLENSKEKTENIKIFINSIKGLQKNINEFLNSLSYSLAKNEKDLSIDNGENSVMLDSIHSSKGLEYPIVILANCGKDLTRKTSYDFITFNKNIGLSCASYNVNEREKSSNIIQQIIKFANKQEEFEENIRLLYVALTRAKNNLVIIGEVDLDKIEPIKCELDILQKKSYMQLILSSLKFPIDALRDSFYLQLDGDIELNVIYPEVFEMNNDLINSREDIFTKQAISQEDNETINKIFNYNYKNIQSTTLPVKNSVSQLNELNEIETSYNFAPRNLTRNEHVTNLSADKVGTAYHTIMQNIKFDIKNVTDVENSINELVVKHIITKEESQVIEPEKITNCLKQLKKYITNETVIIREQPFIMQEKHCNLAENSNIQDEVLVQGIIDLIIINKENALVIDYKTTRSSEEKLKEIYKTQLDLYVQSCKHSLNISNVKPLIYSFYLQKFIEL